MLDGPSLSLIVAIAVCILFSAYFSSTETAFSSLNKARLKGYVKNGARGAKLAYDLSERFDKILSIILIGNNIVNIVGASLATVLFTKLMVENPSAAVTVSTIVMTVAVLIFGEITPKIIAKERPEKIAMWSAPILKMFMIILAPFALPFTLWKKMLANVFKFQQDTGMSDEELITIVEETEQLGGMDKHESELIKSAIEFDECETADILTSRFDIVAVPHSLSMAELKEVFVENGYSRVPVYAENIDQILGVVNEKDFYKILFQGETSFDSIIKPVHFTVAKTKISDLLRAMQVAQSHISIVVDEFGLTTGLVTIEDILEELVGEIWDEHDEVIEEFNEVEENKYKVLASANLDEFFEEFDKMGALMQYEDIQTVGGFVMEVLGHVPEMGEQFEYENLSIKITEVDYKRIVEIEVKVNPIVEEEE